MMEANENLYPRLAEIVENGKDVETDVVASMTSFRRTLRNYLAWPDKDVKWEMSEEKGREVSDGFLFVVGEAGGEIVKTMLFEIKGITVKVRVAAKPGQGYAMIKFGGGEFLTVDPHSDEAILEHAEKLLEEEFRSRTF